MPQALITIGGSPGTDEDLPINTLVQLNNVNIGGEVTYTWAITDQPEGAADALSSTSIQNPTFTPLKEGSYRVRLVVNFGLADEKIDTVIAGVLQFKTNERVPASEETTEAGASGWKVRVNQWLQRLDDQIADPGTVVVEAVGALAVHVVVGPTDITTIKTGLPGEEPIVICGKKLGTDPDIATQVLGAVLQEVDGTTPVADGNLMTVRRFGAIAGVSIVGAMVGDGVYVSDTGTLDRVPGTVLRRVGDILGVPSPDVANITFFGGGGLGGGVTLQSAYSGGRTIAQTSAEGTIAFSNTADDTDLLSLARTKPGTASCLDIVMDPASGGNAIDIDENGVGFGLKLTAAGVPKDNETRLSSFGLQFLGTDDDFNFLGITNAGVGIIGRALNITGAPGSDGDGGTVGGTGGAVVISAGRDGANGGAGGGTGGSLAVRAGSGLASDGNVAIADADTKATNIGNVTDNPPTTFLGTGLVDIANGDLDIPESASLLVGGIALAETFTADKLDALLRPADQVSATGDITTVSATDVLMTGMTITPGLGNYLVMFSASFDHSASGGSIFVNLYNNGVLVAHTERQYTRGSQPMTIGLAFQSSPEAIPAAKAFEVRWRTSGATATVHERTFTVKELP